MTGKMARERKEGIARTIGCVEIHGLPHTDRLQPPPTRSVAMSAMICRRRSALSGSGFQAPCRADPECKERKDADRGNDVWCLARAEDENCQRSPRPENDNTDPNLKRGNLCSYGQAAEGAEVSTGDIPSAEALDASMKTTFRVDQGGSQLPAG